MVEKARKHKLKISISCYTIPDSLALVEEEEFLYAWEECVHQRVDLPSFFFYSCVVEGEKAIILKCHCQLA